MSGRVATAGEQIPAAEPHQGPHRARKRFGQNFLHDAGVVARIVDAIDPRPGQSIVEIGPGQAALTGALIERAHHLKAIEIDRDLAARLRMRFSAEKLTLIEADALTFDWSELEPVPLRIVGNLPYNISTPLLFALMPIAESVIDQHFMLQKEVVDRMVASPGGKTYGRLSVMLQFRYRLIKLFDVPRGAFKPAPQVTSSVVRMQPLASSELPDVDAAGVRTSRGCSVRPAAQDAAQRIVRIARCRADHRKWGRSASARRDAGRAKFRRACAPFRCG